MNKTKKLGIGTALFLAIAISLGTFAFLPAGTTYTFNFASNVAPNPTLHIFTASAVTSLGVQSQVNGNEGVAVNPKQAADGSIISVTSQIVPNIEYKFYHNGILMLVGRPHNLVTNNGMNFTATQLVVPSATNKALYGYLSTNTTAPAVTWMYIATELTGSGSDRQLGVVTYNSNANYTITWQFNFTGTVSGIASFGVGFTSTVSSTTDLFAAFQFSPTINAGSGDRLVVTQIDTATGT